MSKKEYETAIIGAGPAGLFAAYELTRHGGKSSPIVIFDKGSGIEKRVCPYNQSGCKNCNPCGKTEGVMGAGLYSDGKLHFHREIIPVFQRGLITSEETDSLLQYTETLFEKWGLNGQVYPLETDIAVQLAQEVKKQELGDSFELMVKKRTRHIGSDNLPRLVSNMITEITTQGDVDFQVRSELINCAKKNGVFHLTIKRGRKTEEVVVNNAFIGLGRRGSSQVQNIIDQFGVPYSFSPVQIGGRVELPSSIMDNITEAIYNPCFRQINNAGHATFTFCANPHGYLTTESLVPGVLGVNGESKANEKSPFTNFAVLTELPVEIGNNPNNALIEFLHKKFNGNIPLAQTTADFFEGKTQDERRRPQSTLENLQYGNIATVFPEAITEEIRKFLFRLNEVCPGVISHESLFIAPEAKIRGIQVAPTNKNLRTNVEGLYLTGDSSGLSTNIVAAAITGILAARDSADERTRTSMSFPTWS